MFFSVIIIQAAVLFLSGCDNPVQDNTKKDQGNTEHETVEIDIPSYLSGSWRGITPQYGIKNYVRTFDVTTKKVTVSYINTLIVKGTDTPRSGVRDIKFFRKGSTEILSESFQVGDRIQVFNNIIVQEGPNRFTLNQLMTRTVPPDSLETFGDPLLIFERLP